MRFLSAWSSTQPARSTMLAFIAPSNSASVQPASKPLAKLADLLGAAKKEPDKWTTGAPSHLATLLMAKQAQLKLPNEAA
jgi:tripartite-type tricarboxylate transporter receptor subunit TctC